MNCIIIDDEKLARTIIKTLCDDVRSLEVVSEFPNAMQAIKYLNEHKVDLIFLDIHMPDFTGFDFVKTLKNPPSIVLTTSDPKFAIEAFQYECIVDYLLKPIATDRFKMAIEKAKKHQLIAKTSDASKTDKTYENDLKSIFRTFLNVFLHVKCKKCLKTRF